MAENNTTTMAKPYWLTKLHLYKEGFYHDYITNASKRIQTGQASVVGQEFWDQYGRAYKHAKDSGGLIIRAKLITDDTLTVLQIYRSREDRIKFLSSIDKDKFANTVEFFYKETEEPISEKEKNQIIEDIINTDKKIIQALREDHRRPGMIIGDPLKKEPLLRT